MRTIYDATVAASTWLSPRMVRVTLRGPALHALHPQPAQDVALILDGGDGRRVKRRYTVRSARPEVGELDVDMLIHAGDGPGSRWARTAQAGWTVQFGAPRGMLALRPADWHVFAGDEAALPAISALVDALGPDSVTVVLAEVDGPSDHLPLAATVVRWLDRQGLGRGGPDLLAAALAALDPLPGTGRAYLLGESRAVSALRTYLGPLGITPDRGYVKGYWNLDRAGQRPLPSRIRSDAIDPSTELP